MKVIYKKSIIEQIKEALIKAVGQSKEVDRIELSTKEFNKFLQEESDQPVTPGWVVVPSIGWYLIHKETGERSVNYMGITIQEVKDKV